MNLSKNGNISLNFVILYIKVGEFRGPLIELDGTQACNWMCSKVLTEVKLPWKNSWLLPV